MATQQILVWSQIWNQEGKDRLDLNNLLNDHVTIWSELKYLIAAQVVMLQCRVVGGKTVPYAMFRIFVW